jgi:hypothetical protein
LFARLEAIVIVLRAHALLSICLMRIKALSSYASAPSRTAQNGKWAEWRGEAPLHAHLGAVLGQRPLLSARSANCKGLSSPDEIAMV